MNRMKIERLNREVNQLTRDLDSCDSAVKEITRARGATQAVLTKLNSEPIRNQSKINDALK